MVTLTLQVKNFTSPTLYSVWQTSISKGVGDALSWCHNYHDCSKFIVIHISWLPKSLFWRKRLEGIFDKFRWARVMGRYSRVVFRAVLWVGFCCFFLFGVSTSTRVPISTTASVSVSMSKEGATRTHDGSVLNYVSKRGVPNGPDPIHNRYANTCISIAVYIISSSLML